jgi:ABC-type branched-subunit amino acid transport system substrate-binding protein
MKIWEKKFGKDQRNPHWAAVGYDMILIVAEALRKAGSTDTSKIRDAIETLSFTGAAQEYRFSSDKHWGVTGNPFVVARAKGPAAEIAE